MPLLLVWVTLFRFFSTDTRDSLSLVDGVTGNDVVVKNEVNFIKPLSKLS